MNNFKKQIYYVFKDSIKVFVTGAIGFIGITALRLLAMGIKLTGESVAQLFLFNALEIIHVAWILTVTLIFTVDSIWKLVLLLLYGANEIEPKE